MNGKQYEITGGDNRAVLTVTNGHKVQAHVYDRPEYPAIDARIDGQAGVVLEHLPGQGWMIRFFGADQDEPLALISFAAAPDLHPRLAKMLER